jgi:hypothetical protein
VNKKNDQVKFALDIKTTFRRNEKTAGFTLGSHGGYFKERDKDKNIQLTRSRYVFPFYIRIWEIDKIPVNIASDQTINFPNKNDYIKPIHVIREEFIRNYNEYGVTNYIYLDDTHNDNSDKLADLAKVVQSLPFKISFASYLRIDLLRSKPEQYQMLYDGGLVGCFFGIETLNYESAKCIGKGLHPDKVVEELYKFKFILPHVKTMGGFICGLPYETKESVTKWADQIVLPSFPLHTSYIEALLLNRNPNKLYRSEFEKETDSYYTWENDSMTNWDNGSFNREWALNFCLDRFKQNMINKRIKLVGFHTIMARSVNIDSIPSDKKIGEVVVPLRTQIRRKYIDKLFNG